MKVFILMLLLATPFVNAQKTIALKDFSTISVSGNMKIQLVKSSENKLVVTTNDADNLKIENTDNRVVLELKDFQRKSLEGTLHYNGTLSAIVTKAGSTLSGADVIKSDVLALTTNSGSSLSLNINVNKLSTGVESGSEMKLSGTAQNLSLEVNSGASIKAKDLVTNIASVAVKSGASATINVTDTLAVKVASGASARVFGNPKNVTQSKSSGGSIHIN